MSELCTGHDKDMALLTGLTDTAGSVMLALDTIADGGLVVPLTLMA
jgi:hypothetical protein